MHHERSERHVRADRAYPLDDHRERRGRVLLLGKGAVLTQRVAGPLAAELDEKQQRTSPSFALRRAGRASLSLDARAVVAAAPVGHRERRPAMPSSSWLAGAT